jgi:serine/threonine-protein kinase
LKGAIDMAEWDAPGYTKLRELGSGGFGEVVLARHDASGTLVAIKYLRRHLLADTEFAEMFRGEASVLSTLDDPNVVRLYEYLESPSGAAIVMELVDGVSLRQILTHQGATTAEAALVVLKGSLLGLGAAHQRGVVHRDYKPENVLVNGDGVSKLTDFGIAARAGDRPPPAGTLVYAPPEQFSGTPASPAGDVYAATATFYECMVGRPPFIADTAEALLYQHLSQPVPLDPVPEPLRPLVIAGMAKEPRDRPADGTSFVTALNSLAAGAYGPDWEERGRSHLGEAALLLALLWPSGASPAAQGLAVEQVNLSPASPSSQASAPSQASAEAREAHHLWHLRHLRHLQHLRDRGEGRRRRVRPGKAALVTGAVIVTAAAASALAIALNQPHTLHDNLTVHSVSLHPAHSSGSSSSGSSSSGSSSSGSSSSGSSGGSTSATSSGGAGSSGSGSGSGLGSGSGSGSGSGGGTGSGAKHPAVTKVSPSSGTTGGGTAVTITGTNLGGATSVSFGGAAGKITADSATQITVTSPAGKGTVTVTVTTAGGSVSAGKFTYVTPAPAVTGLSPSSGTTGGGTAVTITGTNLGGATGVSFGGAAGKITADSGTQITVTSPPGSAGTVTVTVTTAGGSVSAGKFTYVTPPPTITAISPSSGSTQGGTTVTISGTNLGGATVSFGGAAAKISADSGTQITVTTPPGSAGTVTVTVTTPGGSASGQFTYNPPVLQ